MSIQHFAKRLSLVLFFVIVVIIVSALSVHHANATGPNSFLITPYFGTKGILSNFDHEFPNYGVDGTLVGYDGTRRGPPAAVDNCTNGLNGSCYNGHDGIDFALSYEHVIAAAGGTVSRAEWSSSCHNGPNCGYGMVVEINHGNGYYTRYGHLSVIAVTFGQPVSAGQIIGTSGNTGNSGGAHLHFGVLYNPTGTNNKIAVDPFGWSGTGADPWAQQQNGATSYCLWKDGEWANVCGGVRRLIPEPINGGESIVDDTPDNTGGFTKGHGGPFNNLCPPATCNSWTPVAAGYNNDMYYTLVNGTAADYWAKWQAPVSANGGMYEVFVYVPSGSNATSWRASYTIRYFNNATQATALVDQYGLGNQWVSLGTYYMTNNDYIYTTDATGEIQGVHCGPNQYCRVGVDAVKFIRRAATYAPYLNVSDGWFSTLMVRNNGGGPAQARLLVFNRYGSQTCSGFTNTPIPAHGVQTWVVNSSCPQAVAATVDGSQDLAITTREENGNGELNMYNGLLASGGSPGWERAGTTVYAPIIKNNYNGRKSKLLVANAGGSTTVATVKFYNSSGVKMGTDEVRTLGVNASESIPVTQCPVSSFCSAQITSSGNVPMAVSILELDVSGTQNRSAFNAFSAGATTNFLPLIKKNYNGLWSGVAVQNLGGPDTTVSLTCYPSTGGSLPCGAPQIVHSNATAVFALSGGADSYYGSAMATSTGQPIATLIYENGTPYKLITNAVLNGPSTTAYAPELYRDYAQSGQTWNSGLSIQNMGSTGATITIRYYDRSGNSAGQWSTPNPIGANQSWFINKWTTFMPAAPFVGSAVIQSTQPVAVMVDVQHTGSGDTRASYTAPNR